MELEGRGKKQPWSIEKVKGIVTSGRIYMLCVLYMYVLSFSYGEPVSPAYIQGSLLNNSTAGAPVFSQYLKSKDYPVWKINVYPTGSNGVQILVILISAWGSDSLLTGCRWPFLMAGAVSSKTLEPLNGKPKPD